MATPFTIRLVMGMAALLLLAAPARADTLYVDADDGSFGGGFNDCRDANNPCASIANATVNAGSGDVIQVAAGTYGEQLVLTKDVTIRGAGARQTTLDAGGRAVAVQVQGGVTATVSGLTITGGSSDHGGGARVAQGASLTLRETHVTGNQATDGAGAYTRGALTVRRSTINANTAQQGGAGGGIYVDGGQLTLTNSTVSGNSAPSGGGIVVAGGKASATVRAATLTRNDGAELAARSGQVTIESTLVGDDEGAACTEGAGENLGSAGYNLTTTGGGCPSGRAGDQTVAPGDLFARVVEQKLTDNGGPTPTHVLLAGSSALDAGTAVGSADQRGEMRAVDKSNASNSGDDAADVGAVELQAGESFVEQTHRLDGTTGGDGGDAGWRFLSMPVSGVSVRDLAAQNLVQGVSGSFPGYDANLLTGYADDAFETPDTLTDQLTPGRGFAWYFFDNNKATSHPLPFDLSVTGTPPAGDVTVGGLATGETWHMLGNPYDKPLDLSDALDLKDKGFQKTVFTYDPGTKSYDMVTANASNSTDEIEAWTGFWVERSTRGEGAESLTISHNGAVSPSVQEADTQAKKTAARSDTLTVGQVAFRLVATRGEGGQEVARDEAIRALLHPQATAAGWDAWDASKPLPLASPRATLAFEGERSDGETTRQAQWSLPDSLGQAVEAPMRLTTAGLPEGATLALSWPTWRHVPTGWTLTFIDRQTGRSVDLREQSSYTFAPSAKGAARRRAAGKEAPERTVPLARKVSAVEDSSTPAKARFALRIAPAGAVGAEPGLAVPASFALAGNAPNPFRSATTIRYALPRAATVHLTVFDVLGRRVRTLLAGERQQAGRRQVRFAAQDLAAGVYFYRLRAGDFAATRRMVLVR